MDTEDLLKSLKEYKVKFVIIGATAFPVHGYSRATLDIDIFIDQKSNNGEVYFGTGRVSASILIECCLTVYLEMITGGAN